MMTFNPRLGYVPMENVDQVKLQNKLAVIFEIIENFYSPLPGDRVFVAGCGDGTEARLLGNHYNLEATGIDSNLEGDLRWIAPNAQIGYGDLERLSFEDGMFSLAYSYHVLEHVHNPPKALYEMSRVLVPGGVLFIGFPNRHRAFAYVGRHNTGSFGQTLMWNLRDYRDRIKGTFRNELGAHAGFSEREFLAMTRNIFSSVISVRADYMARRHKSLQLVVAALHALGLDEFAFPSNYFICRK